MQQQMLQQQFEFDEDELEDCDGEEDELGINEDDLDEQEQLFFQQ